MWCPISLGTCACAPGIAAGHPQAVKLHGLLEEGFAHEARKIGANGLCATKNTGDEIICPFCGSSDECHHLLALIDQTFSECSGGYLCDRYHIFRELINTAFVRLLRKGGSKQHLRRSDELSELWRYARAAYSPGDEDVALDEYVLTRLIIELLTAAGGVRYRPIESDGASGYCSAWALFHANNPQAVFEAALADLNLRLDNIFPISV